jgi:hypothetical protein
VREQVEGVFDPTRSFQGARIDRHSDLFRKLLPVECAAEPSQFDGALEKTAIHLVGDQALAECRQRALRERRVVVADHPENHLPTRVHDGQLNGLRIRCARIRLEQHDHRE